MASRAVVTLALLAGGLPPVDIALSTQIRPSAAAKINSCYRIPDATVKPKIGRIKKVPDTI